MSKSKENEQEQEKEQEQEQEQEQDEEQEQEQVADSRVIGLFSSRVRPAAPSATRAAWRAQAR